MHYFLGVYPNTSAFCGHLAWRIVGTAVFMHPIGESVIVGYIVIVLYQVIKGYFVRNSLTVMNMQIYVMLS